jgi:hypothetical protein
MMQMGHEMNYPAVIRARAKLQIKWMQDTIKTAADAPIQGVVNLD